MDDYEELKLWNVSRDTSTACQSFWSRFTHGCARSRESCAACRPSYALSLPWSTSTLSLEVGRATPLFKLETHDPRSLARSFTCDVTFEPFEQGHEKLVQREERKRRKREREFNERGMKVEEGRESVLEEHQSLYFCRRYLRSQWLYRRCGAPRTQIFALSCSLCTLLYFSMVQGRSLLLGDDGTGFPLRRYRLLPLYRDMYTLLFISVVFFFLFNSVSCSVNCRMRV